MCVEYVSTYPCSHTRSRWEYCGKAKTSSLLRLSKPGSPCEDSAVKNEPPNLQDSCGSTCLTRPYKCSQCGSPKKQLCWRCVDCGALRDRAVEMWKPCVCSRHVCSETVIGDIFCESCSERCEPSGPQLKWMCHTCGAINQTHAGDVECRSCLH
ncbi:hypothetical protein GGR50DRAFT_706560, partial [Xylaria sp. CBS 124048]